MKPPVVVAERAVMRPAPTLTRAAEPTLPKAVPTRVAQNAVGGLHLVKPGETLTSIAQDYGTTRPRLAAANAIDEWTNVRIGQKLKVPGGEPARQQAQVDLQAKSLGHLPARAQAVARTEPAQPAKGVKTVSIKPTEPKQAEAIAAAPVAKVAVGAKPVVVAKVDKPKAEQIRTITAKAAPQAREDDDAEETASLPTKPAGKEQQGDQVASTAPASDAPQFRWPVKGRIIQAFGQSSDGINISVPEGTEVKAAEGGVVAYAGSELKGYGNLVLIRHANGFVTAYAHAKDLDVKRGDTVKRGQTIATAGQTGNVTSPQLLFELRKGATPVDPRQYLSGT
jgi:murein DD-endopeptidase MepM/ murein hydrolase activator NlpD